MFEKFLNALTEVLGYHRTRTLIINLHAVCKSKNTKELTYKISITLISYFGSTPMKIILVSVAFICERVSNKTDKD